MPLAQASGPLVMGLAYQPYVGQWSRVADNPYAPDRFYTPSFNTYLGGIDARDPAHSLLAARQRVDLRFDRQGRLESIDADGSLKFQPDALRGTNPSRWSQIHFRPFEGATAQPARSIDSQVSVYRQLAYLVAMAKGAPLTLATYGTGFQAGYWREINGQGHVTLPVWTASEVRFFPADGAPPNVTSTIDEVYFHFPPTAAYVRAAPERIQIETRGKPGRDLELVAVHQTLFEPADKGDPHARLNPGFFAGDANAQIALAAAEINAQAGKRVLSIKLGVENLAVEGSLINDRMRFGILSALAQAQVANARYPGTVTHLILSNEYTRVETKTGDRPTSTEQITEMLRYARAQMATDGAFAELDLQLGVRGHRFREVDIRSTDSAVRQFTQDVAGLVAQADFLMENLYPSPEAVESARATGRWDVYFEPERGELANQWRGLREAIASLPSGKRIDLMIGEIGHPTNGISFNLPGYVEGDTPVRADSAFAAVTGALDVPRGRIRQAGIDAFQRYFDDDLAATFLTQAFAWSRATGVQIHAFEAFNEPQKSVQNLPLPGLTLGQSLLSRSGGYGAEAHFGILGYTGVADFHARAANAPAPTPGARLADRLPADARWAGQFAGRFYPKLPAFDFAGIAASFNAP